MNALFLVATKTLAPVSLRRADVFPCQHCFLALLSSDDFMLQSFPLPYLYTSCSHSFLGVHGSVPALERMCNPLCTIWHENMVELPEEKRRQLHPMAMGSANCGGPKASVGTHGELPHPPILMVFCFHHCDFGCMIEHLLMV